MSLPPHTPSPLHLAAQAQRMARDADPAQAKVFNTVLMVTMGAAAAVTLANAVIHLFDRLLSSRERRQHHHDHSENYHHLHRRVSRGRDFERE